MDLKELRRLPMPKLRDLAKAETDLQGVGGMEKEELIKAERDFRERYGGRPQ